jgi:hypothetical protein
MFFIYLIIFEFSIILFINIFIYMIALNLFFSHNLFFIKIISVLINIIFILIIYDIELGHFYEPLLLILIIQISIFFHSISFFSYLSTLQYSSLIEPSLQISFLFLDLLITSHPLLKSFFYSLAMFYHNLSSICGL